MGVRLRAILGGGGVVNYGGTLTITNSTIAGNSANSRRRGGEYTYGGTLTDHEQHHRGQYRRLRRRGA